MKQEIILVECQPPPPPDITECEQTDTIENITYSLIASDL